MTKVTHNFFYVFVLFLTLYMFRAHRAHHQERQIVSIQPLIIVTLFTVGGRVVSRSEVHFRPAHDNRTQFIVSVQTRRLRGNGNLVTEVLGFLAGGYSGIGIADYEAL
jgi:uncharacterized membrane protein YfcA